MTKLAHQPEDRFSWHYNRITSPAPLAKLLELPERLPALTARLQADHPEVIDTVVDLPCEGGRGRIYATTEKWSQAVPAIPGYQAIPPAPYREQWEVFLSEDASDVDARWWDDVLVAPRILAQGHFDTGDNWVGPHPEVVAAAEEAMTRFRAELPQRKAAGLDALEVALNSRCARQAA